VFGGRFLGELVEADDDGAEVEGTLARDGEMGDEAVRGFVRVLDEAGAAEFGEVFGGVDAGDADATSDFFDGEGITVEEFIEDAPTDGVGDGGEEAIEGAVGGWTERWHKRRWVGQGRTGFMGLAGLAGWKLVGVREGGRGAVRRKRLHDGDFVPGGGILWREKRVQW
jgi:hypothetical protein